MRKIHINNNMIALIVVLLIAAISVFALVEFSDNNVPYAKASNLYASNLDLDSDNIAGSNLTISDYPSHLHATKAAVKFDNNDVGYALYGLNEDDPIVNIVPKDHFFTEGQVLDMGDEYGYFIKTTRNQNGNYLSTVLVFDITTNTNLFETIDRVIVEVSHVFQYKYIGLTNSASSEYFHGLELSYNTLVSPCIVAYPSKMQNGNVLEFGMTEEYYLKDVSFGASLYNEQALNRGDSGYDPSNDYGSYFTGFDYSYQGKYREYGEFSGEDLAWRIADTIRFGLGYMKRIPIVGSIASGIGTIYSIVSYGKGWAEFIVDTYNAVKGEIKTDVKKITATCFYQNRDDQLKYYRDENGEPVLAKTAAVVADTDRDHSMWYGVGDNVTAYFNIGHSALNGRTPNYTRFTDQLALQIVDSSNDEAVAAGSTIIQDSLRSPETKQLAFLDSGDIYMLPDGEDHLQYNDIMYESDYNVQVDLSETATVTVNGESKTGKDLSFTVHAAQHSDIDIDINGNTVGLKGSLNISLNESTYISSISAYGRYMLKNSNLNGIKVLQTNNSNLIIEEIFTYDNGQFNSYESYIPFESGRSVTYPFESGQAYYIVVYNNGSAPIDNVTLQVNNIQSIEPEKSITVSENESATSFVNTYGYDMSFQLILPQQDGANAITIYNENGISIGQATVMASGDTKYSFALSAGEQCYIFYSLSTSVTFTVVPYKNFIKWQIDGSIYNLDYKISLPRGEKYEIRLYSCEDNIEVELTTAYNIDDRADYFTFSNNILSITYDVPYEYVITIVPENYPYATLRIIPTEGREDHNYTITFDKKGGSGGTDSVEANYNRKMPNATKPSRTGYEFIGYYAYSYGGTQYYDSNMVSVNKWDKEEEATLYALWKPKTYNISFNQNGGSGGTTSITATYGEPLPLVNLPTRTGYNFLGYFTSRSGGTCYYDFFDPNYFGEEYYYLYYAHYCDFAYDITLYAQWETMTWKVGVWASLSNSGLTTIPDQSFSLSTDQDKIYYVPGIRDYDTKSWTLTYQAGTIASGTNTAINMRNLCVGNYSNYTLTIYYQYNPQPEECVAAGTLITLADGRQVPVESLTGNEMLLVWNMQTGSFDVAPILFIDCDPLKYYEVINLSFSDGTVVKVISEHAFWDFDMNRYVYLDENAAEYIGHWFNKQITNADGSLDWTRVKLVGVEMRYELTTAYSPVTYGHLCYYVNGMLSMPGGITGFMNIFEVDEETFTIDRTAFADDIAEYGLFTYEEFYEIYQVPEEIFNAFNGRYLKVSIGKGLITYEQIGELIERYSKFF